MWVSAGEVTVKERVEKEWCLPKERGSLQVLASVRDEGKLKVNFLEG